MRGLIWCRDVSSKSIKLLVKICCFLPMFFMFFSFVLHLHRSSPSFLLAPSYILLYPIFVQGSIQIAVVDWFQVHPISLLELEHLRATQNQHTGVMENVQGTSDINELLRLIEIRPIFSKINRSSTRSLKIMVLSKGSIWSEGYNEPLARDVLGLWCWDNHFDTPIYETDIPIFRWYCWMERAIQ